MSDDGPTIKAVAPAAKETAARPAKDGAAHAAKAAARNRTGGAVRAVVFADITGSSALYQSLGDLRAMSLITRCLVAMEEQVYHHRGEVIKTVGEEMLSLFPDANTGANAVIAMQQRVEHFAADAAAGLSLRIGLHSGPLIEEHGDVFGDGVNTAARLVKLAGPGQILTDAGSLAAMRAGFRRRARALDRRRVKGKSSEIELVELGWRRRSGEPFTTEQATLLQGAGKARMLLRADGREVAVDSSRSTFTIGRDAANDLPVVSRKASRQHARIEWRRDKFVLFDHSTNGTYVIVGGEPEILVKHESFVLRGCGKLSIGEPAAARGRGIVEFECR
jgi:class 3 adenylate cyclase